MDPPAAPEKKQDNPHQAATKQAQKDWDKRFWESTTLCDSLAAKSKEFGLAELELNNFEVFLIYKAMTILLRDSIPVLAWVTIWSFWLTLLYTATSVVGVVMSLQGNVFSAVVGVVGMILRLLRFRVAQPRAFRMFSMVGFGEMEGLLKFPKVPTSDEFKHRGTKLLQGILTAAKHKGRYTGAIEEEWQKYDAWQQALVDATIEWQDGLTNFLLCKAEIIKIWSYVEFIAAVVCVATPGKNVIFFLPIAIKAFELILVLLTSSYRKEAMVTVRDGVGEYLANVDMGSNYLFRVWSEARPCCSCSSKWKTSSTKFICTSALYSETFVPDLAKARLACKMACPGAPVIQFADVYRRAQENGGGAYIGAYSSAPPELGKIFAPSAPESAPASGGTGMEGTQEGVPGETAIPISQ